MSRLISGGGGSGVEVDEEDEKEKNRKREKDIRRKKSPPFPSRVFQRKKIEYSSRVIPLRGTRPQGQLVLTDGWVMDG